MATDPKVQAWRKAARYLPRFMRDFHDQKDLFKALHETIDVEANDYTRPVTWVSGQCYVIDIFLWFMAQHGYTLQRSPQKLPFTDIQETISTAKAKRDAQHAAILREALGGHQ